LVPRGGFIRAAKDKSQLSWRFVGYVLEIVASRNGCMRETITTPERNNPMTPKLSTQTHVGNHKAAPSIKKRMSKLLCAGVALFVISAGVVQAADDSDGGFLPNARIVSPNLVVRDEDGKVNTVRYDAVNAMLLNEFLKEHRQVEEQKAGLAPPLCEKSANESN
jgi:hypothetical protein